MFVIFNALKSISRSKGRNILIGIIVFTIAVSSCVALSIKNAANDAEQAGIDQANITASISLDRQKLMESAQGSSSDSSTRDANMSSMRELMQQYSELGLDEQLTYAKSNYVKEFYYASSSSLNASGDFEPVSNTSSSTDSSSDSSSQMGQAGQGGPDMQGGAGGRMIASGRMSTGDFSITGYSSESAMTSFISGGSQITDGEMFDIDSSDYHCLINKELAVFNELSIGDTITFANPNDEEETYEFTITGIYTSTSSSSENDMMFNTAMDPANQIYISYTVLESILGNSESVAATSTDSSGYETTTALSSQLTGTYVFANKDDYESFTTEVTDKGLSEYYTVSSMDVESYESSLLPLQNLSSFATTFLLVIFCVGGIILIVINMFNIRERKFEVGVLTAIGIKKGKVAFQFITELLVITIVAIIIGSAVGAIVSVPVANKLLESQVTALEEESQSQEESFGRVGNSGPSGGNASTMMTMGNRSIGNVSYLDEINATTDLTILFELIGIGLLLTIISSLAAVIFVLRYEPLQILANRA